MEDMKTAAPGRKNWYDVVPAKYRPYAIAALVVIPALVIWARYDGAVREQAEVIEEQQAEIQELTESAAEPAPAPVPTTGGAAKPRPGEQAAANEWRTVVSADGKLQMDLPAGTRLTQSEGFTYVMVDPPSDKQPLPIMAIKIATGVDKQGYRPDPNSSVMLDIGLNTYWLYTWEFTAWEPFARVVASFKVL